MLSHETIQALMEGVKEKNAPPSLEILTEIAKNETFANEMVEELEVVAKQSERRFECCRALMAIAEIHFVKSGCTNSVYRTSNSFDPDFAEAFAILEKQSGWNNAVEKLSSVRKSLKETSDTALRICQQYEHFVFALIRNSVCRIREEIGPLKTSPSQIVAKDIWVEATSPARIDLSGSWTDTPPICTDFGGSVCGASIRIDGKRPIGCKMKKTESGSIKITMANKAPLTLEHYSDFKDFAAPDAPAALIKACLVFAEVVQERKIVGNDSLQNDLLKSFGAGFEIHVWSNLPHGSGLGTSSILAGCILSCLWTVLGFEFSMKDVLLGVLVVEQILTTGGGWQDQVNGLLPGIKLASSPRTEDKLSLQAEVLTSPEILSKIQSHLLLVFTGDVRLAKDLLQSVVREWYIGNSEIPNALMENYATAKEFWEACKQVDLAKMGEIHRRFWECKKKLAKGAETPTTKEITEICQPFLFGESLAGAGGGGFMLLLTKTAYAKQEIEDVLKKKNLKCPCYEVQIDTTGLEVSVQGERVHFSKNI